MAAKPVTNGKAAGGQGLAVTKRLVGHTGPSLQPGFAMVLNGSARVTSAHLLLTSWRLARAPFVHPWLVADCFAHTSATGSHLLTNGWGGNGLSLDPPTLEPKTIFFWGKLKF